jgi:hypothetical protein
MEFPLNRWNDLNNLGGPNFEFFPLQILAWSLIIQHVGLFILIGTAWYNDFFVKVRNVERHKMQNSNCRLEMWNTYRF